jgi:signal transduction histidine kinase
VVSSRTSEDDGVLTLVSRLRDGTVLTLTTSTRDVQSTLATLGWVMAAASTAFLVVAVVGVTLVVRRSLRPLDVMTATATSIAAGDRGRRLRPHRHDTEIGRAAVAIDSMLDAVEGAEDQAVAAETRLRAFLSDAAHELRTPVAGVRAAAETLVRAGVGPDQERLAVHVVRQAGRASRLVDDMLMTARLDRGIDLDRSAVELGGFLRTEVERLALRRPSLDVRVVSPEHDVPALVDADRIAQVVGNVADNAARATGGTGRLLVTLATDDDTDTAVVRLEDDGPGIAVSDRDRVFDRLVRLRAAREDDGAGAGLGLPIARGLARAHGGDLVAADPLVLDGAAFVLTVPCLPRRADAVAGAGKVVAGPDDRRAPAGLVGA